MKIVHAHGRDLPNLGSKLVPIKLIDDNIQNTAVPGFGVLRKNCRFIKIGPEISIMALNMGAL